MTCHICKAEAVTRCFNCGELVCAEHAKGDVCPLCSTGIVGGDPRAISAIPLPAPTEKGWWRPRQADEFKPTECYECKGLARGVCRNCQGNYCQEHAGVNGLCKQCERSANLGIFVVAGIFGLMLLLMICRWLFN